MDIPELFPHFIQAIESNGLAWKRERGSYRGISFQCPIHRDSNPSGRAWIGETGCVVVGCYACNTKLYPELRLKIISALGLKVSSLYRKEKAWDTKGYPLPDDVFEYRNENNVLKYRTCRFNFSDRDTGKIRKRFTVERYVLETASFVTGLGDVKPLLYLTEKWHSCKQKPLIWVEGEQKANILDSLGFCSTSIHGGSGNSNAYQDDWDRLLKGRDLVFIPDNCRDGEMFFFSIFGRLMCEGIANSLRITRLPMLSEKQDVWDWVSNCRLSLSEETIRARLLREIYKTPKYQKS